MRAERGYGTYEADAVDFVCAESDLFDPVGVPCILVLQWEGSCDLKSLDWVGSWINASD